MSALKNAIQAVNGVGAGGNIYAIGECIKAYAEGVTPAQVLDGARRSGKNNDRTLASHKAVVYGAWAIVTLNDERLTPELAYKFTARIGADNLRAIVTGNADDKFVALESAWETEVAAAALRKAERDAQKATAEAFITGAREQVNSLLALTDKGIELSDNDTLALANLAEDIRVMLDLKVGASV